MARRKQSRQTTRPKAVRREWTPQRVAVGDLHFDLSNPRLAELGQEATESDILTILWRQMAVDEIAYSIAANGFFEHEPLFATRERGRLVVIEGNRRLAAVCLLRDAGLREKVGATDLPRITDAARRKLDTLPVIIASRSELWQFIGFKHVNGPQSWGSFAKAKYISWVHTELDVGLDEIAEQIGDRHDTVRRLNHGYLVLAQAEDDGLFHREDRWKGHFSFSHLYTGLSYPGVQKFIGTSAKSDKRRPVPPSKRSNLRDLMRWLFGSARDEVRPVVRSQNPDLRILDEILQSREATAALKRGLGLQSSHDISKGDEALFQEALQVAKKSLQEARGTVVTGYHGERSSLSTAHDIADLANRLVEDMESAGPRRRDATTKTGRRR